MTEFVEVNTQDLSGAALDWAMAKAEALDFEPYFARYRQCWEMHAVRSGYNPERKVYVFEPSTDWAQGGRLIEKHVTALNQSGTESWWAHAEDRLGQGPTPLIAACRAIVASVIGDIASVPKELLP